MTNVMEWTMPAIGVLPPFLILAAVSAGALAQTPEAADSVAAKGNKEEGNRNVMLNASTNRKH